MNIYMSYKKDSLKFNGFYLEEIHGSDIPQPYLFIDDALWKYFQSITTDFKIKEAIVLKEIYTIEDKDIIEIIPFEYETPKPTRLDVIEEQNANLIKEDLQKDIQIKDLNMSLAQTTLNLINKDIEVKDLNTNLANTTLNLVSKDIEVKDIQKDIANLILQSIGGK
ncbi:MAG: hypothetical protein RR657_01690 [Peptostreptococcaceae bacterium]